MTLPTTEVAVKLNFNHVILEAKSKFVPNAKKFPEGIPEILYPQAWDGQTDDLKAYCV